MAHIDDVPEAVTGAGQDFNYVDPPSLATIVLVNAPLDASHINVGLNKAAYDAFIAAEVAADRAFTATANMLDPAHDLQVPFDYETAATFYNYGRVTINGRDWYCFYTPIYLNKTVTRLIADIDEFASYTWDLGYSFIERGHVAVAASSTAGADSDGSPQYCLEPEPFEPGPLIGYAGYEYDPLGDPRVLVASTADLTASPWHDVASDTGDTASDHVTDTLATGHVTAPVTFPGGNTESFAYTMGGSYDDLFSYPYADSEGLSAGNTMHQPFVTGAIPSTVDGLAIEGGAYVYDSVGDYLDHMTLLAHTPWMVDGISHAVPIPGGSGDLGSPTTLTPWTHVESTDGSPSYEGHFDTGVDYTHELVSDWSTGLPAAYGKWIKLLTAPYSMVQIGNRLGDVQEYAPQTIYELGPNGALSLHVQGAFYPQADVVAWIAKAANQAGSNSPLSIPLGFDLPQFQIGRDVAYAGQAAEIAAQRSQAIYDLVLASQRADNENVFTQAGAYLATAYAIIEAAL